MAFKDVRVPKRVAWGVLFGTREPDASYLRDERYMKQMLPTVLGLASQSTEAARVLCPSLGKIAKEAAKSGALTQDELVEILAYLAEVMASDKQTEMKWVLPLTTVDIRPDLSKEVDVITIVLSTRGVTIKLTECTKSDASNKALDDYSKLVKLKTHLDEKRFDDLRVDVKIIGASDVAQDFLPLDHLLDAF